MMISEAQVRLALEYLQNTATTEINAAPDDRPAVPADLMDRVLSVLEEVPETRTDRVEQARRFLLDGPTGDEVAGKMIGRIISDSLR